MSIIPRKIIIIGTIAFILLALLFFCSGGLQVSFQDSAKDNGSIDESLAAHLLKAEAADGLYLIVGLEDERILFLNQVDGYGINLPNTMRVTETKFSDVRMVLADGQDRLEIYKEPVDSEKVSAKTYVSYSSKFLENTQDHKLLLQDTREINNYQVVITQWSRDKLKNVQEDNNYYTCMDIIDEEWVYTFIIKSGLELGTIEECLELADSFYTFEPTVKPPAVKFRQTENQFWDAETAAYYNRNFIQESDISWGIFNYAAPEDMSEIKAIESEIQYRFNILLAYKHVQKSYPENYVKETLDSVYEDGRIVELTLQTTAQDEGEGNMVYDVLDGEFDSFLFSFAQETAEFGHPVLFRLGNEMNGDWCMYSGYHTSRDPEVFKGFYKYIYQIFKDAGADNVIWVWNPNERSFPDFKWNNELMYYPGDEFVDMIGLTGYNTGTYYAGEIWRSFSDIYSPLYQRMVRISDKPLMITEFASSSVGGDKEEWVRDMFSHLGKYPRIRAAIWWDGCDWDSKGNVARPYFIDESSKLLQIFRLNINKVQGT